jgi:predicted dehydrogenase
LDVELVGIVDPSPERRAAAPANIETFATLGEALAAGLAVMIEKPMADDEGLAAEVVADAERRGLLLGVGLVERCNPAVAAPRM